MRITSSKIPEIYQPLQNEHVKSSYGISKVKDSIEIIDEGPCEDCIRSMVTLILAPVLIPMYAVLSMLSIMLSIAMMFIVAQAILVIVVSLFIIFK